MTTTTAAALSRRPTYEDLKRRAEEGGYGGGRGVMDSREWYELCYFEPLEDFMLASLAARFFPELDANDIVVCLSTWIYAHSVSTPTYERIADRNFWLAEGTASEAAMKHAFERGYIFYNIDPHDPSAKTIEPNEVVITLRQDIEQFLWL